MSYLVTARKWRPMKFEDVIGQAHITTTLRNAIARNRLSHAYLFSGPRGVGKTTTARILAKAINCINPQSSNPDNQCEICKEITEGRNLDVLEIDGASNRGIEQIRDLRESVKYVPTKNKYKVYIIDEVHMLTKEAFNALLKTLEEPPVHVIFVFATTEIHKVPSTILSRCQRFDFRRIATEEIIHHLKNIANTENIKIDDDALLTIAKKGDGSMRDAQSIFDQVVSFCGYEIDAKSTIQALGLVDQEIFFKTTEIIKNKDSKAAINLVDEIISLGYDIKEFLSGLAEHFRNFIIVLATNSTKLLEVSEVYKKRYIEDSKFFKENDILRFIKIVTDAQNDIKWDMQPRYKLEIALVQMTKLDNSVEIEKIINQIHELKKKLSGNMKIEGSVMASTPKSLTNNNKINSFTNPFTENYKIFQTFNTQQTPAAESKPILSGFTTLNISEEVAIEKWMNVIQSAGKNRVYLKTILDSSKLIECRNGTLKISCSNAAQLEMIKKNQEYLTQLAQSIYGAKIRLETILDQTRKTTNSDEEYSIKEEHPLVTELIEKLGAIEIASNSY